MQTIKIIRAPNADEIKKSTELKIGEIGFLMTRCGDIAENALAIRAIDCIVFPQYGTYVNISEFITVRGIRENEKIIITK